MPRPSAQSLLWSEESLAELDDLAARKVAARKVAAWEVEDAISEEETHSTVRESAVARAMDAVLTAARIEPDFSIDDVADRSGVPGEICAEIANLAHMINLSELSALAPVVGMTAVEVLVVGEKAAAASD